MKNGFSKVDLNAKNSLLWDSTECIPLMKLLLKKCDISVKLFIFNLWFVKQKKLSELNVIHITGTKGKVFSKNICI